MTANEFSARVNKLIQEAKESGLDMDVIVSEIETVMIMTLDAENMAEL